ncbi:Methyl-CpG-binding domain protein 4 [Trichoplax sp. H2]|nr:Methyl-CpG-binding domain protein 4 [Trichoplax sp. H2]|eukprot:RDD42944.1 Methyl-CpG-binding domain protein 4 [Trichoplax sp. H2]
MPKSSLPKGWKLSGKPDNPRNIYLITPDGCKVRYPSEIWRYVERKNLNLTPSDFAYYQRVTGRQMISDDKINKIKDANNGQQAHSDENDAHTRRSSSLSIAKERCKVFNAKNNNDKLERNTTTSCDRIPTVVEMSKNSTRLQSKNRQKTKTLMNDTTVNEEVNEQTAIASRTRRSIRNVKVVNHSMTTQMVELLEEDNMFDGKAVNRKSAKLLLHPIGQSSPVIAHSKINKVPVNTLDKVIGIKQRLRQSKVNLLATNNGSVRINNKTAKHVMMPVDEETNITESSNAAPSQTRQDSLGLRDRSKLVKTFKAKVLQEEHTRKLEKPGDLDYKTTFKTCANQLCKIPKSSSIKNTKLDNTIQVKSPTIQLRRISNRRNIAIKNDDQMVTVKAEVINNCKQTVKLERKNIMKRKSSVSRNADAKKIKIAKRNNNITKNVREIALTNLKLKQSKNKSAKLIGKGKVKKIGTKEKMKKDTKDSDSIQNEENIGKISSLKSPKNRSRQMVIESDELAIKSKSRNPRKIINGKRVPRHIKGPKWIPPKSPYNLIQEKLFDNPWKLLISTLLLHNITVVEKKAIPLLWKFFGHYPTPEIASNANWKEMAENFSALDMQHDRAKIIIKFSGRFMSLMHDWYILRPSLTLFAKMEILDEYIKKDWCYPCELFGIGKYGNDSYRIFCVNEWKKVFPRDYNLVRYHKWLCQKYKYVPRKRPNVTFDYTVGTHDINLSELKDMFKPSLPVESIPDS